MCQVVISIERERERCSGSVGGLADIDRRLRVLGLLYIFSFLSTYSVWNGVSGGRYIEKRERERERGVVVA